MPGFKSLTLRNALVGLLRDAGASVNSPAGGYFAALSSAIPTATTFSEIAGNGYTRISVPPTAFRREGIRIVVNASNIEFPIATPAGYTVQGVGFFPLVSGGTGPDWSTSLVTGITVAPNGYFYFPASTPDDPGVFIEEAKPGTEVSSNYWADKKLGLFLGEDILSWGTVFIALGTTQFNGTSIAEISGNGYIRADVPCSSAHWEEVADGQTRNLQEIIFDAALADWPQKIRYFAVCDAESGGNIIWAGELPNDALVFKKDKVLIPPLKLRIKE